MAKFGNWIRGTSRHPVTRLIAPAIGLGAAIKLLFFPDANGKTWIGETAASAAMFRDKADPAAIAQQVSSIAITFAGQVEQNAVGAGVTGVGAALLYKGGRILGF